MIEINGMAHVMLTVSAWEKCRPLYEALLPFLGLKQVFGTEDFIYYVGGRTALGLRRCEERLAGRRFVQGELGLHHLCFRCRSREDVDSVYEFLKQQEVTIVRPPEDGPWAPGYYSFLVEDPSGIRIEFNFVPGKGMIEEGAKFTPTGL
ncbi:MAG TPA: VOC family protein [Stellaceae bacterium]|nr:VOC family protein [Stellaceae bacterium]